MLDFGPAGERTLARWGRPARAVPYGAMAAYESETGSLLVMENLLSFHSVDHPETFLPIGYGAVTSRAPTGLAALHDGPDAVWSWRPLLYHLKLSGCQRLGSQTELEYRWGLAEANALRADLRDAVDALVRRCAEEGRPPDEARRLAQALIGLWNESKPEMEFAKARERADALLRENLTPQQRLDVATRRRFFVRGRINRLYLVEIGNGFAIADPTSHEPLVSLCLHPEEWIPDADVALATKLAIDSGNEEELLAAARPRPLGPSGPYTRADRKARALEERWALTR